jgi:hypothetical protein
MLYLSGFFNEKWKVSENFYLLLSGGQPEPFEKGIFYQ